MRWITGETAEPFTPDQDQALGDLAFEGYKGYADDTSKLMAHHYLTELVALDLGDRATVLGALAARGVSVPGLREIAKLKLADAGCPRTTWNSRDW